MASAFLVPPWFFGYDVVFEVIFALVTLAVSLYAFKIYKLSDQHQSKLFGISFLFFSFAYIMQSLLNLAILFKLNESICEVVKIQSVNTLNALGMFSHMFLFLMGLVTLAYMTLKTKNGRVYSLILVISILSLLMSFNRFYWFYFLSSILLIYICMHYLANYLKQKQANTLLPLTAFLFLLFSHFHFIFAVNHSIYYFLGHILELAAYILLLINLTLILKK